MDAVRQFKNIETALMTDAGNSPVLRYSSEKDTNAITPDVSHSVLFIEQANMKDRRVGTGEAEIVILSTNLTNAESAMAAFNTICGNHNWIMIESSLVRDKGKKQRTHDRERKNSPCNLQLTETRGNRYVNNKNSRR